MAEPTEDKSDGVVRGVSASYPRRGRGRGESRSRYDPLELGVEMAGWGNIALIAALVLIIGAILCAVWWWVPKLQMRGLTFENGRR
jgi:hypothetical protein